MPKTVSYLGQMFGGAWTQDSAINRNAGELAQVEVSLQDLQDLVARQDQDLTRLRLVVMALTQLLVEQGTFTEKDLEMTIQELTPKPVVAAASPAYVASPMAGTTTCDRCGKVVPTSATEITSFGVVCDVCFETSKER